MMHADVTMVVAFYDLVAETVSTLRLLFAAVLAAVSAAAPAGTGAQDGLVPFDSGRWKISGGKVVEHLGRPSLVGSASIPDADFEDGVIEYDVAVTGARSYPGIVFRSQPDGTWERFYIRPHRSGSVPPSLYPDVLQYVPAWHGIDGWQLYSGPGYTAPAVIPVGRWVHVKVEVAGTQARVFLDGGPAPALVMPNLRHGRQRGGVGVMGPADGSAFVSNFSYRPGPSLRIGSSARRPVPPGFVRDWALSQAIPALGVDQGQPLTARLRGAQWERIEADEDGLIDVGRHRARGTGPDLVYAKTTIASPTAGVRAYRLGYSDIAEVFVNGVQVFGADSAYQGRDPSFLGIIGLHDTLHLPFRAGDNEVVVAIAEVSGGWGFMLQDATAEFSAAGVAREWKTGKTFAVPESAAYDPTGGAIYVSNYDPYNPSGAEGRQAIMKMPADGSGTPVVFASGLRNPTGLAISGASIYAVEPNGVATVDLATGRLTGREQIPGAVRLNDIAVAPGGTLFVSDSQRGVIHRRTSAGWDVWLDGPEVARPNGLTLSGGRLVWANNGDGSLKAADLATKKITRLADLPGGIIDGLAAYPDGTLLASHNEGRLYRIATDGSVTLLLDLSVTGIHVADFSFDPASGRIIVPTFLDNRVMAVRIANPRRQ